MMYRARQPLFTAELECLDCGETFTFGAEEKDECPLCETGRLMVILSPYNYA